MTEERVDNNRTGKPRVLMIDDEIQILDVLQRALSDQGFEVVAVENGADGVAHYAAAVFDAVLLDIRMLEMDGFEVLDKLRSCFKTLMVSQ